MAWFLLDLFLDNTYLAQLDVQFVQRPEWKRIKMTKFNVCNASMMLSCSQILLLMKHHVLINALKDSINWFNNLQITFSRFTTQLIVAFLIQTMCLNTLCTMIGICTMAILCSLTLLLMKSHIGTLTLNLNISLIAAKLISSMFWTIQTLHSINPTLPQILLQVEDYKFKLMLREAKHALRT